MLLKLFHLILVPVVSVPTVITSVAGVPVAIPASNLAVGTQLSVATTAAAPLNLGALLAGGRCIIHV